MITKEQSNAIYRMACELEETGRLSCLARDESSRKEQLDKNRDIQCALQDYLAALVDAGAKSAVSEPVADVDKFELIYDATKSLSSLMKEAQAIVESKYVFKKFIRATPLENDVAVWMAEFAKDALCKAANITPPAEKREPLTDEQMWAIWNAQGVDEMNQHEAIAFAREHEAAHGIGVKK